MGNSRWTNSLSFWIISLIPFIPVHSCTSTPENEYPFQSNHSIKSQCIQSILTSDDLNFITMFARFVTPVLFGIFFLTGTVGNSLVIAVIISNAQMRNTTNILIFSLAVADLALLVVCVPSASAIYITGRWPLGKIICNLYQYSAYVSFYCSAYTLLLMSLDRFLAVVYPMECVNLRTSKNAIKSVIVVWSTVMLSNMPLLLQSGLVKGPANGQDGPCLTEYCAYKWLVVEVEAKGYFVDNLQNSRLYFLLFFLFGYLIPFIIISALYMTVIFRLRCRKSKQIKQSIESKKSKRRVTKLVVTVVGIFGISMLPLHVVFLYQYFAEDTDSIVFRIIQIMSNCLAYGNSCINPVLYAFISVNFRRAFHDLFCYRRTNVSQTNTCVPLETDNFTETAAELRPHHLTSSDEPKISRGSFSRQALNNRQHTYNGRYI